MSASRALEFSEIVIFYLATLGCLCMLFSEVEQNMKSKILEMGGREEKGIPCDQKLSALY